jgi:GT2 family glycosyltransferase
MNNNSPSIAKHFNGDAASSAQVNQSPRADAPFCLAMVLGYRRFEYTTRLCLDSLLPQALALPTSMSTQVLAIDNGSPDDSAELLRRYAAGKPELLTQYNEKNWGFGGGMNQAAQSAAKATEWLLLVNSDLIFPTGSLQALSQAMRDAGPQIGLVGPVTNGAGNAQKLSLVGQGYADIAQASSEALLSSPISILWPVLRADFFCVAIRQKLWHRLNGLDPIYGRGYYEDFDFSLRAKALGFECAMCENSFVYHEGGMSFKLDDAQKKLIRHNKGIFMARFPGQEIPHSRLENLRQISRYISKFKELQVSAQTHANDWYGLALRLEWRLRMAALDQPRSFFKRWSWQRKLRALQTPLANLGFADLYQNHLGHF